MTAEDGSLLRAEIAEQPARWLDLMASQTGALDEAAQLLRRSNPSYVVFVGRGTSDHAGLYGQYLLQELLGVPVALATPSAMNTQGRSIYHGATAVVALSQSGASPDVVSTIRDARAAGVATIAFTNNASSALAEAASVHVNLSAGAELSVAATKSYTTELVALYAWLHQAAGARSADLGDRVSRLSKTADTVIASSQRIAPGLADELEYADRALIIGRGLSMAGAREAALKLMETSTLPASGWSAADAKHGPLGQVVAGTPVFLLNAVRRGRGSVTDLIPLLEARGARIHMLVGVGEGEGEATATDAGRELAGIIPTDIEDELIPMLEIIPFQQLALELALLRGLNPDKPAGLSKVTRTL